MNNPTSIFGDVGFEGLGFTASCGVVHRRSTDRWPVKRLFSTDRQSAKACLQPTSHRLQVCQRRFAVSMGCGGRGRAKQAGQDGTGGCTRNHARPTGEVQAARADGEAEPGSRQGCGRKKRLRVPAACALDTALTPRCPACRPVYLLTATDLVAQLCAVAGGFPSLYATAPPCPEWYKLDIHFSGATCPKVHQHNPHPKQDACVACRKRHPSQDV